MNDPHLDAYTRLREHEHRYASTILLLGYGGFFALWATTADQIPKSWFGIAGLLMAASLLLFIVFELAKTIRISIALSREGQTDEDGNVVTAEHALLLANDAIGRINRSWPWFFIPSVAFGLSAGAILLWQFWDITMAGHW